MSETHPAVAVLIDLPTARKLFPGTPSEVFHACALPSRCRGLRLTFGAAFSAACAYWQPRAKAAQSARHSVAAHGRWQVRKAAAAEAALAHLQEVIRAELAALDGQGD